MYTYMSMQMTFDIKLKICQLQSYKSRRNHWFHIYNISTFLLHMEFWNV
jgi:hypothetical protein